MLKDRRETKRVWGKERERSSIGRPGELGYFSTVIGGLTLYCRVNKGRVIFEIGGAPVREELARDGTSSPSSTTSPPTKLLP